MKVCSTKADFIQDFKYSEYKVLFRIQLYSVVIGTGTTHSMERVVSIAKKQMGVSAWKITRGTPGLKRNMVKSTNRSLAKDSQGDHITSKCWRLRNLIRY